MSLTVTAVNDAPSVTVAAGRSCAANDDGGTFDLTVADVDSPLGGLALSATSSNTSVVRVAATPFGGSGASRTVTIAAGASGSATVTAD